MKTYFKLELKRALFSWKTIISFIAILISLLIPYIDEVRFHLTELDGIEYFLRVTGMSYFVFIGPIIAGVVYSTSVITDKKTGFMEKLLEIIDVKTYYKVKLVVNALVNSIIFLFSHLIIIIYFIIIYGVNNRGFKDVSAGAFVIFDDISKISYVLLICIVIPISSVTFSTFILGITTITNKKFVGYILPVFYVILTQVLFEIWQFNNIIDLNLGKLFTIELYSGVNLLNTLIYNLILMLIGVCLLYKFCYKRTLSLYGKKELKLDVIQ
ncbi:hypothetical protein NNC19_03270 [Clostridium sp. SHJSY1]|uniref:hypothetical protein n=1 Tax=Clostridium sp. SHJSY1 TaxID=2942483 RepID=UPI0028756AD2|nr:hypothetical protein [Clostridium sp. SHJSY1]MDS0524685.1 hypothetical protein [Clostridium sp. SHJSY1]